MLRELCFGSCYVYSPVGNCPVSRCSRLLRTLLKEPDQNLMNCYASRVRREVSEFRLFAGYFEPCTTLIPVPGSRPRASGAPWVAECLASAFVDAGLGGTVWTGLRRVHPVIKSATASKGKRPTVTTHYKSFMVESREDPPDRIVLVDDVVTKGRTLLAAASRVQEAFPHASVRAFALLRTMGMVAEVSRLLDPLEGMITWRAGDARRHP